MRQMQQNAIPHDFDATITLNDHYLAPALAANRIEDVTHIVRRAVEALPGAGWIDVDVEFSSAAVAGWVSVSPPGQVLTPPSKAWRDKQRIVEAVVLRALMAVGMPSMMRH